MLEEDLLVKWNRLLWKEPYLPTYCIQQAIFYVMYCVHCGLQALLACKSSDVLVLMDFSGIKVWPLSTNFILIDTIYSEY